MCCSSGIDIGCCCIITDVTVGLHGSSASKFALQASDVNIHVSIPEHLKVMLVSSWEVITHIIMQIPIAVVMKRVSAILQNLGTCI